MKFCTDIHGSQTMNPGGFGEPLTVPLVPSSGQNFTLFSTFMTKYMQN